MSVKSDWFIVLHKFAVSLLLSSFSVHYLKWGIDICSYYSELSITPFSSVNFCFIMFIVVTSSFCIETFINKWFHFVNLSLKILTVGG